MSDMANGDGSHYTVSSDSLLNVNEPTSSGFSSFGSDDDVDPDFTENVEKWKCPLCQKVVRNPVQTVCGHRYCENCLNQYISEHEDPVICPAKEEDCEEISHTGHTIFKDVSARREVSNLLVKCLYIIYGCLPSIKWKDYSRHIESCEYRRVPCIYKENGCKELLKENEIESHHKVCEYKPKPCPQCREINGHAVNCQMKLSQCIYNTFGCGYMGNTKTLEQHHQNFIPQHLEMVTMHVADTKLQNAQLRNQLQKSVNYTDILNNKLEQVKTENQELKDKEKKDVRDLQLQIVKQKDTFISIEDKFSSVLTEFNAHKHELSTLKNSELLKRATDDDNAPSASLAENIEQLDRQLGVFNLRMVEMDLRFQLLEASSYDGSLLWKITNYSKRKADGVSGKTLSLYSQPFYTHRHGYKMCGRVYLNGDGMGKGSYISLFFTVMKGDYDALLEWPFRYKVTFMILDQEPGSNKTNITDSFRPDPNSSSFKRPTSEMNIASGCPLFARQSAVGGPNSHYVKDDTIFIKVVVDITGAKHP